VSNDGPKTAEDVRERYRILVESLSDYAIFLLDPRGYIQTWNPGAEKLKGYTPKEAIGKHFSIFYPREKIESGWVDHELAVAEQTGHFEDEGWRLRKDGTRFWANVIITANRDSTGRLLGFAKITRDLTDRRNHEEVLRQSEERFRLLVDSVRDYAIFMLDPDGRVASWNAGAQRIKGYRPEEIIGQSFKKFYLQEAVDRGWPDHELSTARRFGRFEDEGWRVRRDGTRFWANVVITAVHDPTGELRGFAKVTRDLTERRRVETLEAGERQMNEFLAMLGHELRNPLAPIRNAVAVMREGGSGEPRDDWARSIIERQVDHLSRLVDDLLDVSRVTRGTIALQKERIDLAKPVASAVDAIRPVLDKSRQTLTFRPAPRPLVVHADATRITQVVLNLLTNASKYTREGGHVWLDLEALDKQAVIRVRDDGIGMATELLPQIFDLFVQGERSLARTEGGLGIGLTVVRRLVHLHGGTVTAASGGPGQGSEFEVRLPLVAEATETPRRQPGRRAESRGSGRALNIVVVDDNQDSSDTMAELIRIWGHDVRTALDGMSALKLALERPPDVVLLDLGLPGMSGYDVAAKLRTTPGIGQPLLVAMTGYGQEEDRRRTREAGFLHHLTKPVDPAALQEILSSVKQPS
jgi:PAS domain S-box-containing protein